MDIALNETTGDLDVINGDLYMVTGSRAVGQFLRSKLKTFLGEWFLDERKGIPYFDTIFVKNPNITVIDAIFKSEILSSPGIVELIEYSSEIDPSARKFTLKFKARSLGDDAIIEFNETIGG